MSDNPYETAKGGRLCFKGGALASRSHGVDKKSKKKKKKGKKQQHEEIGEEQIKGEAAASGDGTGAEGVGGEVIYTIDAAKKMKYEDIFPVETKKFGYDPNATKAKSVEAALDDRVKKKADRYCK